MNIHGLKLQKQAASRKLSEVKLEGKKKALMIRELREKIRRLGNEIRKRKEERDKRKRK